MEDGMKEINNDLLHDALFEEKPLFQFDESLELGAQRERIKQKYI